MNRISFTVGDIVVDAMAPYLPQLVPLIKNAYPRSIRFLHAIAKAAARDVSYIVDVGACIGATAIGYALAFPEADILAIEPAEINQSFLLHNTEQFLKIKILKVVVSDKQGEECLASPSPAQRHRDDFAVNTGLISIYGAGLYFREIVPSDLLDNLVEKKVDWLKIDVEGAEMDVLRGAIHIITNHRPIIQVEMRNENQQMAGRHHLGIMKFLEGYQYHLAATISADWVFLPR